MNRTSIGWTDFSSNPVKYRDALGRTRQACVKLSPGCKHCYAETLAKRFGSGAAFNAAEMSSLTPFLDGRELAALRGSKAIAGHRVFLEDMSDLFGSWVDDPILNSLYSSALELRSDVTFQLLTKRAERQAEYLAWRYGPRADGGHRIPARHIWHGVSVEDLDAIERLDFLVDARSAVRFVSFEPLLEDLGDLSRWLPSIQWAIIGGESGPNYRPCDPAWIRRIAGQCLAHGVAVFVKQGSGPRPGMRTGDADLDHLKQFPRSAVPA